MRPAAMVLDATGEDAKTMRALRFDRIRAAFEIYEASLSDAPARMRLIPGSCPLRS